MCRVRQTLSATPLDRWAEGNPSAGSSRPPRPRRSGHGQAARASRWAHAAFPWPFVSKRGEDKYRRCLGNQLGRCKRVNWWMVGALLISTIPRKCLKLTKWKLLASSSSSVSSSSSGWRKREAGDTFLRLYTPMRLLRRIHNHHVVLKAERTARAPRGSHVVGQLREGSAPPSASPAGRRALPPASSPPSPATASLTAFASSGSRAGRRDGSAGPWRRGPKQIRSFL